MKTSSYVFSTLYKNILRIIHGIGTTKASFQDYAMAKVYTNECYITNAPKVVPVNSTKFVGIVGEDLTLSKYPLSRRSAGFRMNAAQVHSSSSQILRCASGSSWSN